MRTADACGLACVAGPNCDRIFCQIKGVRIPVQIGPFTELLKILEKELSRAEF